jgi:hypothetical protein
MDHVASVEYDDDGNLRQPGYVYHGIFVTFSRRSHEGKHFLWIRDVAASGKLERPLTWSWNGMYPPDELVADSQAYIHAMFDEQMYTHQDPPEPFPA